MQRHYNWCLLTAILCTQMTLVKCAFTFKMKMVDYKNPNGRDANNEQCDHIINTACDTVFTFCFDDPDSTSITTAVCSYKPAEITGEYRNQDLIYWRGNDEVNMNGVRNPMVVSSNTRWKGSMYFKAKVEDNDDGWDGVHDLVDKYRVKIHLQAAKNEGQATWKTMLLKGKEISRTSLHVKVMVFCQKNFYGTDCATKCEPKDDVTGHYECDQNTGTKICKTGWEGKNCLIASDDCRSHKCLNGATCVDGLRSYSCICTAGFSGAKCETNVDECASNPCANNGTCKDQVNGYTCTCTSGYLPPNCQFHVCQKPTSPCLNGGTCYDNGKCLCPRGFIGDKCQTDLCMHYPCENGGTCHAGKCTCPEGYKGSKCEWTLCDLRPCHNGGTCRLQLGTYHCDCPPNVSGKNCEVNNMVPSLNIGDKVPDADAQTDKKLVGSSTPVWPVGLAIGIVAVIVLLTIIIVVLVRRRRKPQQPEESYVPPAGMSNFQNPLYVINTPPGVSYHPENEVNERAQASPGTGEPIYEVPMAAAIPVKKGLPDDNPYLDLNASGHDNKAFEHPPPYVEEVPKYAPTAEEVQTKRPIVDDD